MAAFKVGDRVRFSPLGPEALRCGMSLGQYSGRVGTVVRWDRGFWLVEWPGIGQKCCHGPALELAQAAR